MKRSDSEYLKQVVEWKTIEKIPRGRSKKKNNNKKMYRWNSAAEFEGIWDTKLRSENTKLRRKEGSVGGGKNSQSVVILEKKKSEEEECITLYVYRMWSMRHPIRRLNW